MLYSAVYHGELPPLLLQPMLEALRSDDASGGTPLVLPVSMDEEGGEGFELAQAACGMHASGAVDAMSDLLGAERTSISVTDLSPTDLVRAVREAVFGGEEPLVHE